MKKTWVIVLSAFVLGGVVVLGGMTIYNSGVKSAEEKAQKEASEKAASEKKESQAKEDSMKKESEKAKKESEQEAAQAAAAESAKQAESAKKTLTFEQAVSILQSSEIKDSEKRDPKLTTMGADGSVMMSTYPGAKGENQFVVRQSDDGTYTVDATYGSLEGGSFSAFPDQSIYGPSHVTVAK